MKHNTLRMNWNDERWLRPIFLPEHGLSLQKHFTDASAGHLKFPPTMLRLTSTGAPEAYYWRRSDPAVQHLIEQGFRKAGCSTQQRSDLMLVSAASRHRLGQAAMNREREWLRQSGVTPTEHAQHHALLHRMIREARTRGWPGVLQSFSPLTAQPDDTYLRLIHYFRALIGRHNGSAQLILVREQAWLTERQDHLLLYLTLPTRGDLPLPEKSDLYLQNDTCQWLRQNGWRVTTSPYSPEENRISLLLATPPHFTRTFEWLYADRLDGFDP